MKKIFLLFAIIFSFSILKAQTFCDDAAVITNLPYNAYSVNTAFADKDTSLKYCNSNFEHGNDTIFEFTPNNDLLIDIELKNVQIPIAAMVNMFLLDSCTDQNYTCVAQAVNGTFLIENAQLTAGHTYYILITNILYNNINSFIFDLEVREHYAHDLRFVEVNEPRSNCDLGSYHEVSFDLKNAGNDTVFAFDVKVIVNGNETTYSFNDTILPGQEKINFPFSYYDLSQTENTITGIIQYPLDENNANDTIKVVTHNLAWVNTFPYVEDFEDLSAVKWYSEWEYHSRPHSSWQTGQPQAAVINSAASGVNAAVTNLTGDAGTVEYSYFVGPCFDFSSLTQPVIEFDMWKNLGDAAYVYMQYNDTETDNWTLLGSLGEGENWYDPVYGYQNNSWTGNSNSWIHAKLRLNNLGGKSKVRFRFVYKNNTNTAVEGFAVDNIKIAQASNSDVGITRILNPVSDCNTGLDTIKIMIKNYSPDSVHSNFPVKYTIDDSQEFTDTVRFAILPNDSAIFSFSVPYDFSQNKLYKISVETILPNDDDTLNDICKALIYKYDFINTFPYENDFESNSGSWNPEGINASWQYGTPNDSVISSAASGVNIWATNLSGYHNEPEESYLISPCFDISQMHNPLVKFNCIYDLYLSGGATSSYVQFQFSSDNGNHWTTIGDASQDNWYNAGQAWTGKLTEWTQMSHSLSDLLVEQKLQFRFKLYALQAKTGFAFDDFTICDLPKAGYNYTVNDSLVSFTDTSLNADSRKWLIDGNIISEGQSFDFETDKDSIQVELIVQNTCGTDTLKNTIHLTGINSFLVNNVKIYPNPVKNILQIEFSKPSGNLRIELFDINSRKIFSLNNFNSTLVNIDFSVFSKGVYLLKISDANSSYNKRIIKM